LQWWDATPALDSADLMNHLQAEGLAERAGQLLSARPVPLPACVQPGAMPAEAEAGWWHYFGLLHRERLEMEVAAAAAAFMATPDAAAQGRLVALCAARDALLRDAQAEDLEAGG
jgi:DNA primase